MDWNHSTLQRLSVFLLALFKLHFSKSSFPLSFLKSNRVSAVYLRALKCPSACHKDLTGHLIFNNAYFLYTLLSQDLNKENTALHNLMNQRSVQCLWLGLFQNVTNIQIINFDWVLQMTHETEGRRMNIPH